MEDSSLETHRQHINNALEARISEHRRNNKTTPTLTISIGDIFTPNDVVCIDLLLQLLWKEFAYNTETNHGIAINGRSRGSLSKLDISVNLWRPFDVVDIKSAWERLKAKKHRSELFESSATTVENNVNIESSLPSKVGEPSYADLISRISKLEQEVVCRNEELSTKQQHINILIDQNREYKVWKHALGTLSLVNVNYYEA